MMGIDMQVTLQGQKKTLACERVFNYADNNDFNSVLLLLSKQGVSDEEFGEVLFAAAKEAIAEGKPETAINILNFLLEALEDESEAPPLVKFIGKLFSSMGNHEKAREYYCRLPVNLDTVRLCLATFIPALDIDGMLQMKDKILNIIPVSEQTLVDDIQNELMHEAFLAVFSEHNEQYKNNRESLGRIGPAIFKKYDFKTDLASLKEPENWDLKIIKISGSVYLKLGNRWSKAIAKDYPGQLNSEQPEHNTIIGRCGSFPELLEIISIVSTDNPAFYKFEYNIIIDFKLLEQAMAVCDFRPFEKCNFIIRFIDENDLEFQLRELLCEKRVAFPAIIFDPEVKNTDFINQRILLLLKDCELKIHQDIRRFKQKLMELYPDDFGEKVHKKILNKEKLKILFQTSRYSTYIQYSIRDIAEGFNKLGHEIFIHVEEEYTGNGIRPDLGMKKICDFFPDIIFSIDHFRFEKSWLPANIPFISWIQDLMDHIINLNDPGIIGSMDHIFAFSRSIQNILKEHPGYKAREIHLLPIPANTKVFFPLADLEKKFDVTYVSHLPDPEQTFQPLREGGIICEATSTAELDVLKLIINEMDSMSLELLWKFSFSESFRHNCLRKICKRNDVDVPEQYFKYFERVEADGSGTRFLNDFITTMKMKPLAYLLEHGIHCVVFGDNWSKVKGFAEIAPGKIENGQELNEITNQSKINLSLSLTSYHMRVPEIIAAQGFIISRKIPQDDNMPITDYYKENEEVVLFSDEADLLEKVCFYLENENERVAIAKRAYDRLMLNFTNKQAASSIIKALGTRS
jgi:spore maturation protein CgeB/tetratricopeptide (TPR) repeat protein